MSDAGPAFRKDLLGGKAELGWFVPGRVEVLGKHTDYAGGRSLVCAIERGFRFVARCSGDRVLTITRADSGERVRIPLDPGLPIPEGEWAAFPSVVARRLARDFGITHGVELAFGSDLPVAAGLSSGSALTIGVFLALAEANALAAHPRYRAHLTEPSALAEYLGCLENGRGFGPFEGGAGVGTMGGCEDQAAILLAEKGTLKQFRFVPVLLERTVPFPEKLTFVVGSSGVVAEKTAGALASYNAAAAALAEWSEWSEGAGSPVGLRRPGSLGEFLRLSPDALPRLRSRLATRPAILARLEQFVAESEEIVPRAADAFLAGDLDRFGALVDRSQEGAERALRNQVPETVHLQRSARRLGALAASAFGAGFGGSVWALVESQGAEAFRLGWERDYEIAFPGRRAGAEFFLTRPGEGARRIEVG